MAALDPGLPGNEVVFSRDRATRLPLLRRAVAAVFFAGLAAAASTLLGPPMFIVAGVLGLGALGGAVSYAWKGRFRTVLTPQGIELHGYVRHFIPWHEVAGFRVKHGQEGARSGQDEVDPAEQVEIFNLWLRKPGLVPYGGHQTAPPRPHVTVQVVRSSGQRMVLPAPVVSGPAGDPQLGDKLSQLEAWRQRYGPQTPAPR